MNLITSILIKLGILKKDLDYYFACASMLIIIFFFGYQKWFPYEAQGLTPYISHGPLIFWMYPVFGIQGATWFLGVSEWLLGVLLFWGFWNKKAGIGGFGRDSCNRMHRKRTVRCMRILLSLILQGFTLSR